MEHDHTIDITQDNCPLTFVRTKLALEQLNNGQVLEVIGCGKEPRHNVPNAVVDHGHEIIVIDDFDNQRFRLLIRVNN